MEGERIKVDFAVIGSGAAGQKAAIQAAKLGKSVVVIEKGAHPGGACLNTGTVPSKSLREAIMDLTHFYEKSFYGRAMERPDISFAALNFRLNKVLAEERRILRRQFRKNGIRLLYGFARFIGEHRLQVEGDEVEADVILIATGSRPRNPGHVPFDGEVILDSTRLLTMDRLPERLIVLGGGVIGSEYASFFSALGTHVTVVDKRSHILPHLDSEIGIHLQTSLTDLGLEFRGNLRPERVERVGSVARVTMESGEVLEADKLLYALGREANVAGMEIESVGIELTERGHIPVNEYYQTAQPHIYAAGDVIAGPCLASTGMEQGRRAARHAFGMSVPTSSHLFPLGIYTIPEISCIGKTEDELLEEGVPFEVGRAYYYEMAKGNITGSHRGLLKLIFQKESLQLLGVHIIGRSATELIHIGQMAMAHDAPIDLFVNQVFNYPTFAEGYRIAALNGINKIQRFR
jgi:NAD(P) transhydrogenase